MENYIPFPEIDPVLFSITLFGFTLALRWYALAYIAGILLGWFGIRALVARPQYWPDDTAPMTAKDAEDLLTSMIIGIILGGRLGFVFFYQPAYYLENPQDILKIWQGGMSFHGGLLGVITALIWFCWSRGAKLISTGDALALVAPIGIFFGRLANFINAELWGRPTTSGWGVLFPGAQAQTCPDWWDGVCARHPSQLYEAALEGIFLFAILFIGLRLGWLKRPGLMIGVFIAGYGAARTFVEFFRQADAQFITPENPIGFILRAGDFGVTMGQLLSLPMVAVGIAFILLARRHA